MPSIFAQETTPEEKKETPVTIIPVPTEKASYLKHGAIAINVSSLGVGLEYAHNINTHLNGRFRLNYFSLSDYQTTVDISDNPVLLTTNATILGADLALEYLPFKRSSFKLIGGAGMLFNAEMNSTVTYDGSLEYGDISLDNDEIGDITVGLDYSGLAPYIGFGFGRAVPKKSVGFGIEIGSYYVGSPKVELEASKMFEPTATEEKQQLEDNLKGYTWLPFINLRLAFRI
jgi:hypothetical protein